MADTDTIPNDGGTSAAPINPGEAVAAKSFTPGGPFNPGPASPGGGQIPEARMEPILPLTDFRFDFQEPPLGAVKQ